MKEVDKKMKMKLVKVYEWNIHYNILNSAARTTLVEDDFTSERMEGSGTNTACAPVGRIIAVSPGCRTIKFPIRRLSNSYNTFAMKSMLFLVAT
mmetsp:Transcript_2803/g.3299  ORF Transcript_2803/g.3299 Transcript_2803/m.3299 type:complete len:94 (-) Transcript_2803:46-327(-)